MFARQREPAVSRNLFRERLYNNVTIPSFEEARSDLPRPVFPQEPFWVEMYWRAWELAWKNLRQPTKLETGLVANYIDTGSPDFMFLWDSVFMSQFGLYGRRQFDFMGTLDNFYARQHDDGYICRQIYTETGDDYFSPFDPNGTGPNILAWGEWRHFRLTGDKRRLQSVFWPLLGYQRWCRAHRTWPSGLYWATGMSSGMDNQTRVPDSEHYHQHWTWIDASAQALITCRILSQMATLLEEEEIAQEMAAHQAFLSREIYDQLWDDSAQFYKDADPQGRFSPVKSVGAYWALLGPDLTPENRLTALVTHLRDENGFRRLHQVPSQAADSTGYDGEAGSLWRGGVWPSANFMLLKGLRTVGKIKLAHEIAVNHLEQVGKVFAHTDTFWNYYAADAVRQGQGAIPDYVGWTGLTPISVFLEEVIGLNVDWPLRRVSWDRHYDGYYGVEKYPLGKEDYADFFGDDEKLTITTTAPFTLVVTTKYGRVQSAVAAGRSEISF
ncbi:MAG TPA: trehalase family glycosidase [Anaerolineae bacterium]|nr:trehalase family glycosidase [Anaerolineae bacterium]